MIGLGTSAVFRVTPGKQGQEVEGVSVFDTVRRATEKFPVDPAPRAVPLRQRRDLRGAGRRYQDSSCLLCEKIPVHDALRIRTAALSEGALVIWGNTLGAISADEAMMGFFPHWVDRVYRRGRIGVMPRSGSFTNEVAAQFVEVVFGASTLVDIGGDPVPSVRFAEVLPLFESDLETDAVAIIGELGGTMEEEVAEAIEDASFTKPLVASLGEQRPKEQRWGTPGPSSPPERGRCRTRFRLSKERALPWPTARAASVGGVQISRTIRLGLLGDEETLQNRLILKSDSIDDCELPYKELSCTALASGASCVAWGRESDQNQQVA